MVCENVTMEQKIVTFASFISSILREVKNCPGFINIGLKTQQLVHHLCFLCDLVRDNSQDLNLILQEHTKIKVCPNLDLIV